MTAINYQLIRSPSGDELVVLSKADFEALSRAAEDALEDADDVAIFDTRIADLRSGADAALPVEVSLAMSKGDTLLRAIRRWRDMTQMYLSHKTGIAQGYLSEIEAGKKSGNPETLRQIAKALDVDPAWLGVTSDST